MTAATNGGGGFDVDRLLNFEKRTGVKDGEIETFITKVDAVNAAIQAMKVRGPLGRVILSLQYHHQHQHRHQRS